MKKLIGIIVGAFVFLACVTLPVNSSLLAKYYETKIEPPYAEVVEVFPEVDYGVVLKGMDDPGVEIVLVWTKQVGNRGVVFLVLDDEKTEQRADYCGFLFFNTKDDFDTYLAGGDAVITHAQGANCDMVLDYLDEQLAQGRILLPGTAKK